MPHRSKSASTETTLERRDVLQRAGLAAGALALGTSAATGSASAQTSNRVLGFSRCLYPGRAFEVIDKLDQGTTVELLQVDGDPVPEISRPDEWTGYIIRYEGHRGNNAGLPTFLFVRDRSLRAGDTGVFGGDIHMFNSNLNLLRTSLDRP
ncbi:twin-arginine translocation signal domain-containing protein [Natrinema salaciae]|nr:twin-arginine translocation signal domain-containing protein [Natrinema salaciae]